MKIQRKKSSSVFDLSTKQRRRQDGNKRYWEKREREELQRKRTLDRLNLYDKQIDRIHKNVLNELQKEIESFYTKYVKTEKISMAEAKKRASKFDVEAYSEKVKRIVETKNLSKEAREQLRLYNLKMRVNRLELLKANIGIHLVSAGDELSKLGEDILSKETDTELRRQAGILGNVSSTVFSVKGIVNGSFKNATFSTRIWANQDLLRYDLERILTISLVQGKSPDTFVKDLRKAFGVSTSNAQRLLRTEVARVQTEAQKNSYIENGYEEFTFLALNPKGACPICKALDGKVFRVKDFIIGENAPPMHPYCHCSTAPHENEEDYQKWLTSKENGE